MLRAATGRLHPLSQSEDLGHAGEPFVGSWRRDVDSGLGVDAGPLMDQYRDRLRFLFLGLSAAAVEQVRQRNWREVGGDALGLLRG